MPLSTSGGGGAPTGVAGGSLGGTYPNPTVLKAGASNTTVTAFAESLLTSANSSEGRTALQLGSASLAAADDFIASLGSSTANAIVIFNGTGGKTIANSAVLISSLATAAQGALADSALQSIIGTTNLLAGDGGGGLSDTSIAPAAVATAVTNQFVADSAWNAPASVGNKVSVTNYIGGGPLAALDVDADNQIDTLTAWAQAIHTMLASKKYPNV